MTKPNILILMPDQHRADCLSCAGHPVVRTPNLDRLADEGMRFRTAYTTSPVCMPARSSFLSGLYCHNHGQWENVGHLPPGADTYLHHVREVGYHTCHVGKSHLHSHRADHHLDEAKPFMHQLGWDEVFETTGPHATVRTDSIMTDHWRQIGCLDTFRDDYPRRAEVGPTAATWPSPMPEGETLDDFVGRTAVDYLLGYDWELPLLLFVGFGGPHEPWDPPADWAERYDPARMDSPKAITEPGSWVPEPAAAHQRALQNDRLGITPEINGRIRALYYAKISHIDWWIGRILDALLERGQIDNTAIIFWSDHGEMLCDKGRLYKSVFYEESVRVPLIIRPPGYRHAGAVSDSLVSQIDVFPTILDIAGCDAEPIGFGRSLTPLLERKTDALRDAVFSEIHQRTMIRDKRFKMVVDSQGTVLKLYDMLSDPQEEVNLVGSPGTADTVQRLKLRMLEWYLGTQQRQRRE